jgi:hypothetical protein
VTNTATKIRKVTDVSPNPAAPAPTIAAVPIPEIPPGSTARSCPRSCRRPAGRCRRPTAGSRGRQWTRKRGDAVAAP